MTSYDVIKFGTFFTVKPLRIESSLNSLKINIFKRNLDTKCLEHIENEKRTVFVKFRHFLDISENSDFGQFLSQSSRLGNILDALSLTDFEKIVLKSLLEKVLT